MADNTIENATVHVVLMAPDIDGAEVHTVSEATVRREPGWFNGFEFIPDDRGIAPRLEGEHAWVRVIRMLAVSIEAE